MSSALWLAGSSEVRFRGTCFYLGLAFYGTWMSESGLFADVVARFAAAKTDMTVDGSKKEISWVQYHHKDNLYDTYNGVRVSGYDGADAGVPLIQAIGLFFKGINVTAYDPYILSLDEILNAVYNADGSKATTTTTTKKVDSTTTTTTTTASKV